MPDNELNSKDQMNDQSSQLCLRSRHWNLEGKITTKVAIPREPLKLPVQLLLLSGRERSWCRTATKTRKRGNRKRQWPRPHLGTNRVISN